MKPRKSILLIFSFYFVIHASQAQVRIFGGPQLTTAKYSIRNTKQSNDFKLNYMAGVSLRTQIEGPLYFAPLLYYSRKGYKVTFNLPGAPPDSAAQNNNTTISTIALAPLLQFNLSKTQSHWFVRFGPGFDVAVSGKEIFDSTGNKQVERSMLFSSIGYSPVTAFATLQLGFEHESGLLLFAHYEHGLSSLNNKDLGPMILHRVAGISVGWRL